MCVNVDVKYDGDHELPHMQEKITRLQNLALIVSISLACIVHILTMNKHLLVGLLSDFVALFGTFIPLAKYVEHLKHKRRPCKYCYKVHSFPLHIYFNNQGGIQLYQGEYQRYLCHEWIVLDLKILLARNNPEFHLSQIQLYKFMIDDRELGDGQRILDNRTYKLLTIKTDRGNKFSLPGSS